MDERSSILMSYAESTLRHMILGQRGQYSAHDRVERRVLKFLRDRPHGLCTEAVIERVPGAIVDVRIGAIARSDDELHRRRAQFTVRLANNRVLGAIDHHSPMGWNVAGVSVAAWCGRAEYSLSDVNSGTKDAKVLIPAINPRDWRQGELRLNDAGPRAALYVYTLVCSSCREACDEHPYVSVPALNELSATRLNLTRARFPFSGVDDFVSAYARAARALNRLRTRQRAKRK